MEIKVKVGIYSWVGPYEYFIGEELEMISPHIRNNLLSDLPFEQFIRKTWVLEGGVDDNDFIEFWRQVREYELKNL